MATRTDPLDALSWPAMATDQRTAPAATEQAVSDWLTGIRQGDEAAFNAFYAAFSPRLYRYLFSILPGDEALVRDAFQNTMLRVVRYAKPLPTEEAAWRWLTRLGRSALYDLLRKRKRDGSRERSWTPPLPDPDEAEIRLDRALDRVLESLPPEDRELVEAFYFERRNQTDLAQRSGTTRKAIESRLARLRERMRGELKQALADE